ncbi:MAG: outer membrane beta-barrel protein [Verrucomicrobiales bacterium]
MIKQIQLVPVILVGFVSSLFGQGMASIGLLSDFEDFDSSLPFTTTISTVFGYDSNVDSRPKFVEDASSYTQGRVSGAYSAVRGKTHFGLNAGFATMYYFEREDTTFNSADGSLNIYHKITPRLTLANKSYLSYSIEPNLALGASASRRLSHYYYGHNNLSLTYAFNRRITSITRLGVNGIDYEDEINSAGEDRLRYNISQEMRYVLNVVTDLVGEYRHASVNYDIADLDYGAHYLLAGLNHRFSLLLRGTLMAGAHTRSYDNGNEDGWKPYLETSLRYDVTEKTKLAWINRVGYEDGEFVSNRATSRSGFKSSVNLTHSFTDRLRSEFGLSYQNSNFERPEMIDLAEELQSVNLGLSYQLFSNIDLNARYSYISLGSEDLFRDFLRHRISAGMSIKF